MFQIHWVNWLYQSWHFLWVAAGEKNYRQIYRRWMNVNEWIFARAQWGTHANLLIRKRFPSDDFNLSRLLIWCPIFIRQNWVKPSARITLPTHSNRNQRANGTGASILHDLHWWPVPVFIWWNMKWHLFSGWRLLFLWLRLQTVKCSLFGACVSVWTRWNTLNVCPSGFNVISIGFHYCIKPNRNSPLTSYCTVHTKRS